ncbi:MAG: PKD domain-containing protein [Catalinimonas sp.]
MRSTLPILLLFCGTLAAQSIQAPTIGPRGPVSQLRHKGDPAPGFQVLPTKLPARRTCHTPYADSVLRVQYPDLMSPAAFEAEMARMIAERSAQRTTSEEVWTLPVIVHVVHNGEAVGSGPNITAAQVRSQLDVLNEDFRRQPNTPGFNTHPAGADLRVEFAPAVVDPDGTPLAEAGIHRVNGGRPGWDLEDIQRTLKPQTLWDPARYVNIWVVTFGGDAESLLGYAQFPSLSGLGGLETNGGLADTDGVVVRNSAFGRIGTAQSPYNGGRTLTHEIGHWLGLRHIWGDGNCSVDDFCDDTPVAGEPNYRCVAINSCPGGGGDMIENYMDYTNDGCMSVFTNDQKARVRTVLERSSRRASLRTSTVHLGNTSGGGAPLSRFTQSVSRGCAPLGVQFQDQSGGTPNAWQWNFYAGGSSVGSFSGSTQNLNFQPGAYDVELIVSNASGTDTSYCPDCVVALGNSTTALPYVEDFEDNADLPGWVLSNPDGDRTWSFFARQSAYGQGSFSAVFDNYDLATDPSGTLDVLFTGKLDFRAPQDPWLDFDVAYAQFNALYSDTLVLYYSIDCGQTFVPFWAKGGADLATAAPTTDPFVPNAQQWERIGVSLGFLRGQPSVHLAVANYSGWGNNLYLDNVRLHRPQPTARPATNFYSVQADNCIGSQVNFWDASANFPAAWQWQFPGGTPATSTAQNPTVFYDRPGTYDVTLTTSNGAGQNQQRRDGYVVVRPLPTVVASPTQVTIGAGESATLTAGGAQSYVWLPERGLNTDEGSTVVATPLVTTVYTVYGISAAGCVNTSQVTVVVNTPTAAADVRTESLRVYPNPSRGHFTADLSHLPRATYELTMIDALGRTTYRRSVRTEVAVELHAPARGMYHVRLVSKDGKHRFQQRIVVQ